MEKQVLLKNIFVELNQLPVAYLLHWYELIHAFREKLPVGESISATAKDVEFDWDALVDEVMKNRWQNNLQRATRLQSILED